MVRRNKRSDISGVKHFGVILTKVNDVDGAGTRRTDFTVEEIVTARAEVNRIDKLLSEAKSKLFGFDMYDR